METTKRILISGSGVAGPTCAYWLHKYGYSTVIAEKATALRDGGQNVDVKGAGQRVIDMMALSEEVEARNTGERGQKYLDAAGNVIAVLPKGALGTLTSDFEILRGDFAQVLFEATNDACEYRFGTFVAGIEERDECVSVTFDNGAIEEFELVICAEGLNSSTRDIVLAAHTRFHYMGAYMAFFKIPRRAEDDGWAHTVNGIGGTFITLRPGTENETTVLVTFLQGDQGIRADTPTARVALLHHALRGRGVIADRIRAELDTVDDFYFGPMSQVHASRWSKGRVVLLGDAAFCPTPFTGAGTALALVAAYVLAGEIKRSADYSQAFTGYERLVRPYVEASQRQLTPRRIRLMHVKSRWGIGLTHFAQRCLASKPVQKRFRPSPAKRAQAVADDFAFADYS
jgi:2-polyprenyl-6-methoxyphenol hydroxylase-like FAD-dependent oxidoreductase